MGNDEATGTLPAGRLVVALEGYVVVIFFCLRQLHNYVQDY